MKKKCKMLLLKCHYCTVTGSRSVATYGQSRRTEWAARAKAAPGLGFRGGFTRAYVCQKPLNWNLLNGCGSLHITSIS